MAAFSSRPASVATGASVSAWFVIWLLRSSPPLASASSSILASAAASISSRPAVTRRSMAATVAPAARPDFARTEHLSGGPGMARSGYVPASSSTPDRTA